MSQVVVPAISAERPALERTGSKMLWGFLAFISAVPLALLIHGINVRLPNQPERAVMAVAAVFAVLLVTPAALYLLIKRRSAVPSKLGLIALATAGVLLTAIYLYWVSFYVFFPADFLTWSESDFVNDILKIHIGYPIYSAQANNESFNYTPGTQLLTYFLAWLIGQPFSIPVYRIIQVAFTFLAALLATLCSRALITRYDSSDTESSLERRLDNPLKESLWGAVWLPFFFLIATNFLTNSFVFNLHDDALAQLLCILAYWLLLQYVWTEDKRLLALMAVIPAIGFFIKQSLAIWAVLYCAQLALFDRNRSIKRLFAFGVAAAGCFGIMLGLCYFVWGQDFFYWTVTALARHQISPLRSFQHVLDTWPYFALSLLSGIVLLRGRNLRPLLGPWLIGLALLGAEAYTSGAAWMRNHMGPGCLVAGIWFIAALVQIWPLLSAPSANPYQSWLRVGIAVGAIGLVYAGLGVIRIPLRPLSGDSYRYVSDIESQFTGLPAKNVLLDIGTWVYRKDNVVMKDRAPSIGERGYTESGDFSGILQRLRDKSYSKILVRNLHARDFWYDYYLWQHSSGIRETLLQNYNEIGQIPGVHQKGADEDAPYLFGDVSILVPKQN